jgi:hypothetical protein
MAIDEMSQRLAGTRIDPAIDPMCDDIIEAGQSEAGGFGKIACMKREVGNTSALGQPPRAGDVLRHQVDAMKPTGRVSGGKDRGGYPLSTTQLAPSEPGSPSGRLDR